MVDVSQAPSDPGELATRLGIALAIGALLGIERQHHRAETGERSFAGLRTFTLISLFGAIAAWVSLAASAWFAPAAFLGFAAIVALSYVATTRGQEDIGTTTEFAAFVAFGLGAAAFAGHPTVAVGVAVVVALLLSEKPALHAFARRLSDEDLHATLRFGILALVILPLLPDRTYPLLGTDVLNPKRIWLMVVLISAVSFTGYVFVKGLGAGRGLELSGLLGGIVSSTATTLALTRRSKETPALARSCATGVLLAYAVMAVRILFLLAVVRPSLLSEVARPLLGLGGGALVAAALLRRAGPAGGAAMPVQVRNPFRLAPAIRFGLLFAVVLFVIDAVQDETSRAGLLATSLLAGAIDADAVALSVAQLQDAASRLAAPSVFAAVLSNTALKTAAAVFFGDRAFGRKVLLGTFVALGGGAAAAFLL
jgi:uncharacterized membrane protein (DUF4010 family)